MFGSHTPYPGFAAAGYLKADKMGLRGVLMDNSICGNLCLDLKRGLRDKRFWEVLGVFSFIFFSVLYWTGSVR